MFTFRDRFAMGQGGIWMRQIFSEPGCDPGKAHPWREQAGAGGHGKQRGYRFQTYRLLPKGRLQGCKRPVPCY